MSCIVPKLKRNRILKERLSRETGHIFSVRRYSDEEDELEEEKFGSDDFSPKSQGGGSTGRWNASPGEITLRKDSHSPPREFSSPKRISGKTLDCSPRMKYLTQTRISSESNSQHSVTSSIPYKSHNK
jgi:hypothetical protein